MTSKITTGFHRIGIVLAIPLLIAAASVSFIELYNPSGAFVADLKSSPGQVVVAWGEPIAPAGRADPRQPWSKGIPIEADKITRVRVPDDRVLVLDTKDTKLAEQAVKAMQDEERRRGRLFRPPEMPLLIGAVSVYYASESNMPAYGINHLKRGVDPSAFKISAALIGFAALAYVAARAMAWIFNGFMGSKSSTT